MEWKTQNTDDPRERLKLSNQTLLFQNQLHSDREITSPGARVSLWLWILKVVGPARNLHNLISEVALICIREILTLLGFKKMYRILDDP